MQRKSKAFWLSMVKRGSNTQTIFGKKAWMGPRMPEGKREGPAAVCKKHPQPPFRLLLFRQFRLAGRPVREDRPVLSFTGCFFPLRHRTLPRRLPFFSPPVKQDRNARRARRHRHGLCPARGLLPGHLTAFDQQSIVISPAVQYNYPNKEALHHGHRKNGTVYC